MTKYVTAKSDKSQSAESRKRYIVVRYNRQLSGELMAIRFEPKTSEEQKKAPNAAPAEPQVASIAANQPVQPVKATKNRPKKK
jgi:hypothetical protein